MRQLNTIDHLIGSVDSFMRSIFVPQHRLLTRESPAASLHSPKTNIAQSKHTAGLLRVDHAGEVCAQGLYQGQALTASSQKLRQQLLQAAKEEVDHMGWCEVRLQELHSRPSILNVLWYGGAWFIGAAAGCLGDSLSLGFVVETERQVAQHLQTHIQAIPAEDEKSHAILAAMHQDELQHAQHSGCP